MSLYRMTLIAMTTAGGLGFLAGAAPAQTNPPASAGASASSPGISGVTYQGLPGVWISQGNHLWFCVWQGNAAPRNQQISCSGTDLPPATSR